MDNNAPWTPSSLQGPIALAGDFFSAFGYTTLAVLGGGVLLLLLGLIPNKVGLAFRFLGIVAVSMGLFSGAGYLLVNMLHKEADTRLVASNVSSFREWLDNQYSATVSDSEATRVASALDLTGESVMIEIDGQETESVFVDGATGGYLLRSGPTETPVEGE